MHKEHDQKHKHMYATIQSKFRESKTFSSLRSLQSSWSICFSLNFSPFGIKHQNGIIVGSFNPIASPKSSIKSKKEVDLFQTSFETRLRKLKHMVSLKGSSCSTTPPK